MADWTVKTTGMVSPTRAAGGSRVIEPAVAEIAAKVALLEMIVSEGLFRYGDKLTTVLTPAGIVITVWRGTIEAVEVSADVLEPPMMVTRTVTV